MFINIIIQNIFIKANYFIFWILSNKDVDAPSIDYFVHRAAGNCTEVLSTFNVKMSTLQDRVKELERKIADAPAERERELKKAETELTRMRAVAEKAAQAAASKQEVSSTNPPTTASINFPLHQRQATSTWWCSPLPYTGEGRNGLSIPRGSHPRAILPWTTLLIFYPCCPIRGHMWTALLNPIDRPLPLLFSLGHLFLVPPSTPNLFITHPTHR